MGSGQPAPPWAGLLLDRTWPPPWRGASGSEEKEKNELSQAEAGIEDSTSADPEKAIGETKQMMFRLAGTVIPAA